MWRSGSPTWQPAQDIPDLRETFAAAPPPISPDQQLVRFFTGTWEMRTQQSGMAITTRIRYLPDLNYQGVQQAQAIGMAMQPTSMPLAGTWRMQSVGDRQVILIMTAREGSSGTATLTIV